MRSCTGAIVSFSGFPGPSGRGYDDAFEFNGQVKFVGLEVPEELMTQPEDLRATYLAAIERFTRRLDELCRNNRVERVSVGTGRDTVACSERTAAPADARHTPRPATRMNARPIGPSQTTRKRRSPAGMRSGLFARSTRATPSMMIPEKMRTTPASDVA